MLCDQLSHSVGGGNSQRLVAAKARLIFYDELLWSSFIVEAHRDGG